MAQKIEDFGEKIGGARKDLYAAKQEGGLKEQDIQKWTDTERRAYVTKENVFPKPNYQELFEEGRERTAVYFIKLLYDSLAKQPKPESEKSKRNEYYELDDKMSKYNRIVEQCTKGIENYTTLSERIQKSPSYLEYVFPELQNGNRKLMTLPEIQEKLKETNQMIEEISPRYLELKAEREKFGQESYIQQMTAMKKSLLQIRTEEDIGKFCDKLKENGVPSQLKNQPVRAYTVGREKVMKVVNNYSDTFGLRKLRTEVKEKQFLFTDDEKKLANYSFFRPWAIASEDKSLRIPHVRINTAIQRLELDTGSGSTTYCYHNEDRFMHPDNWKENTYAVIRNHKVIGNNFETEQEAKAFALEHAAQLEKASPQNEADKKRGGLSVYKPPQLAHIRRIGMDFRESENIVGEQLMQDFGFRGGEFGNWENQNDRQTNLNMSYDAFKDLARILGVQDSDISLGNDLSIAYGARGHSGALAHYEPLANVINLTKMNGAGALAHEWGHALDAYLGGKMQCGYFATDDCKKPNNPMYDVIRTIKNSPDGGMTDYLKNARKLDKTYKKTGNQQGKYWSSEVELFARAFECYVKDMIAENGERSDYLCGLAGNDILLEENGLYEETGYAYPVGEERKRINQAIGKMIEQMKEKEYLHQRTEEPHYKRVEVDVAVEPKKEAKQKETKPKQQKPKEQSPVQPSETEIEENLKQFAEETAKKVKEMLEKELIARQLQEGDVIILNSRPAMDGRTGKKVTLPEEKVIVTKVSEREIQLESYENPEKLGDWDNTKQSFFSAGESWAAQLAKDGFEPLSVKALKKEKPEQQKSSSESDKPKQEETQNPAPDKPEQKQAEENIPEKTDAEGQFFLFEEEPSKNQQNTQKRQKSNKPKEESKEEFGEQLSFFDMDELFEDPTPPEKETLYTNMEKEYFKFCEPYLKNVQYEMIDSVDNAVVLLTKDYDKLHDALKRADTIVSEITRMAEYGFTPEQINPLHHLIVQSADAGRECFVRQSIDTRFNEEQMQDMAKLIQLALKQNTPESYTAVSTLKQKYINDIAEKEKRPDFLKFPKAEDLKGYDKTAQLPANAELIAEDAEKNMQIFQSGRRFYLQEESKVREIAPEFTRMTTVDENARQFAYTPDDVHVYHLKTKGERMHIDKSVSELKPEQIKEGMSCTMPVTAQDGTEQNLTLIYRNASAVTIQTENAEKNMPVRENYDMAYKYTAKQIEAKGGAKGFFQRMEHIAEQETHGISSSMTGIYSKMLSVLPKEKEQQKAELPNFISAEQLSKYAKGIEIPDNAVMIAELNRPDFPNLHLQVFQAEDKFILKHNEKTYELAPELTEKTNAQAFAYTPDNLHVYHITAENGKAHQIIAKLESEQLKEGMSCSMTFSREKGEEPKTLTVIYHENQSLTLQYDGMERTLPVEKKNGANYNYEIKKTKLNSMTGAEELYSYFDFIAEINRSGSHAASTGSFQRLADAFESENYGKHNAPTPIVSETAETEQKETVPEKVTARTDSYDNMLIDIYASIELYTEDSRKANETTDWKQMKEAYEDFLTECGTSESEFSDDTVCHVLTMLENLAELDKDSSMNPTLLNYALNQLEVMLEENIPVEETKENLFYE